MIGGVSTNHISQVTVKSHGVLIVESGRRVKDVQFSIGDIWQRVAHVSYNGYAFGRDRQATENQASHGLR